MDSVAIRGDWSGRVIEGRFVLLEWLGGSEQSGVFFTEFEQNGRKKAVIKLVPAGAGDAKARIAGWEASTALSHPHLMRVYSSGSQQVDGATLLYVVTEYADEVLSEIIPARALTPEETREMLLPMLDALEYLHGKGFVHGHLKPSNIMAVGEELKLSGDSVSPAGEHVARFSIPGVYDAPECAANQIYPAADMWSLGVTLVEVLTQNPPSWDGSANNAPVIPKSVPEPFAGIARRCLRVDPQERCTVGDVRAILDGSRRSPEPRISQSVVTLPAEDFALEYSEVPVESVQGSTILKVIVVAAILVCVIAAALMIRAHFSEAASAPQGTESAPAAAAAPPQTPTPAVQPAPPAQTPVHEIQPSPATRVNGAVSAQVLPNILPQARESIQGTVNVSVRLAVDASGKVSDASLESAGPSKYFSRVALDSARKWKFKPATLNGKPVPSSWILRFQFREDGTEVDPVETAP